MFPRWLFSLSRTKSDNLLVVAEWWAQNLRLKV